MQLDKLVIMNYGFARLPRLHSIVWCGTFKYYGCPIKIVVIYYGFASCYPDYTVPYGVVAKTAIPGFPSTIVRSKYPLPQIRCILPRLNNATPITQLLPRLHCCYPDYANTPITQLLPRLYNDSPITQSLPRIRCCYPDYAVPRLRSRYPDSTVRQYPDYRTRPRLYSCYPDYAEFH
jgi:hypothetical protein